MVLLARLMAGVLLGLGSAGAASAAAPERTLTIGISQYPSNFHPNIDSMAAKSFIEGLTMRPFTAYDENWQLVCMLCTRLPTLENGGSVREDTPDGKHGVASTYTIQAGAEWGDGVPLTTRDVVFTWEVGRHPSSGVSNDELYRRIWKIDVVDERTFTIHDEKLDYAYNGINDFRPLPEHLERKVFAADPASYRNRSLFETDPTNPGLAFGPYRMVQAVPGSLVVLERNPTWWGAPPWFERIVVRAIENTSALEANLLAGDIDMIDGGLGLALDQAVAFERRHGDRYKVLYKPSLVYEHLEPNLDNPILADVRVRRALLLGIDREAIDQRLFGGRQPVADSFVNPLDWVHSDEVRRYAYDPKAAAALLDEAGWGDLRQGVRHDAAGRPFQLELMTTAGNRTRELVQQVLQSQWRQLGLDIRIRNEPARVFFGETVAKRRFGGLALFAWISSPEHLPRSTLHSDQIPSAANGWAGQNVAGYRSAAMDALIDATEVELDRERRKDLWARMQQLYALDLPALPLDFRSDAYVLPRWLEGVVPTGHQTPVTSWAERWRRVE